MKLRKEMIFVILTLMLTLLGVGCGNNQVTSNGDEKLEEAEKTEVDQSLLGNIQSKGKITVGIEGAYPPFNYYDENNEIQGFDVDITNEIADRMGAEVEFVATPWDTILGGLLSEKYDLIISSMAITEERKEKVDFTDPYYKTGPQLFVPKDSKIISHDQVDGEKIGVTIGTQFEEKAIELGAQIVTYKNDMLSFQDMENGRIAGIITDKTVGSRITKEKNYPFHSVGDLLYHTEAGITVRKDSDKLREELNKHLNDMMEDGTYSEISKKWFGEDIS